MARICPRCRRPPDDSRLISCVRCGVPFAEETEIPIYLSSEDISRLATRIVRNPRFWGLVILGMLGIAYAALSFLDWTTRRDAQSFIETLRATSSNESVRAYSSITNQIVQEFKAPRIQETMEKVVAQGAQERIDTVADRLIEQKLSAIVRPQLDTINAALATAKTEALGLDGKIALLHQTLSMVSEEQKFLALANSARLYSLQAFLDLERMSQTTNAFAKDAGQVVWALRRDLEMDRASLSEYVPIEQLGEDYRYEGPFTSEEIADRLTSSSTAEGGANLARKENLKCFVPQLVSLAQKEDNLWVQNRITHAISALSGRKFYPWTLQSLSNWWDSCSLQFTNWPYARFDKAIGHFSAVQYKEALADFESISSSDGYADKSRAFAIACAVEIGDTNRVAILASAWKYPDGRWARWAKAKMNLSTGDVTEATSQFAKLATDCRTFPDRAMMRPGNHVLRKVDWPLYDQKLKELQSTTK